MSGEKCERHYFALDGTCQRCGYDSHAPAPEPSEVAETTAGEREGCAQSHDGHPCGVCDPAEPDAGEVEALDVVTLHDKMLGLAWSCTCGAIGAGATEPIRKAARDHQRAHLAALLDRERREAKAEALREAADATGKTCWCPIGVPVGEQCDSITDDAAAWLRDRAARIEAGR